MKKNSLADKIASLLTTAPSSIDPEDENADDTKATVNYDSTEESNEDIAVQSQIRKKNIDFLADVDERYAGKGGSRKNLNSDEEASSEEIDDNDNDSNTADESEGENEESNDNESDFDSENGTDESESGHEYVDDLDEGEDQTNFETLKSDVSTQVKKGVCVKNQLNIWENLLEMRIQVQKCLSAANKMPRSEKFKEIKSESGHEFSASVQQAKKSISIVLEKFLLLQNLLWKQYPEMKNFKSKKQSITNSDDDEEIPSDTEDEISKEEEDDEDDQSPKKKMKLSEFDKDIQDKHDLYKEYRDSVIQKWHDKTRLPVMKNGTNSHTIINHIEHTLADKAKLIKRTQLKRTEYNIIGEEIKEHDSGTNFNEEYNSEIFDDNDFYHQLLRELIEVKSADLTDPVQLGRQWIQLQNLRSKMKRKIDTKATKGRKIRYAIHTKLVNYMAPIDSNLWSDQAKTELFGSLFGKNQTT